MQRGASTCFWPPRCVAEECRFHRLMLTTEAMICEVVEDVQSQVPVKQPGRDTMNKRLEKRHKRQVARSKDRCKRSEPDLRTPDQLTAAREASRAVTGRRTDRRPPYAMPAPNRAGPEPDASGAVRADVGP